MIGIDIDVFRDTATPLRDAVERSGGNPDLIPDDWEYYDVIQSMGFVETSETTLDDEVIVHTAEQQAEDFIMEHAYSIFGNPSNKSNFGLARLSEVKTKEVVTIFSTNTSPFLYLDLEFITQLIKGEIHLHNKMNIMLGFDKNPSRFFDVVVSNKGRFLEEDTADILVAKNTSDESEFDVCSTMDDLLTRLNQL